MFRFWVAATLRVSLGACVILVPVALGWWHSDPWVILPVACAFTVLFALGKLNAYRVTWRKKGASGVAFALAIVVPIQGLLVGLLFALGVGLSRLWGTDAEFSHGFLEQDWKAIGALLVLGAGVSCAVDLLERSKGHDGRLEDDIAEKAKRLSSLGED